MDSKGITLQISGLAVLVTSVQRSMVWVCAFLSSFHKSSLVISLILIYEFRFVHYLSMIMMSDLLSSTVEQVGVATKL